MTERTGDTLVWAAMFLLSLIVLTILIFSAIGDSYGQCPKDRGDVKLALDNGFFLKAKPATLGDISRMPQISVKHNTPRAERERQEYIIAATLIGYKLESDGDFHLVIQDSGRTMIVEAVDPMCADRSLYLPQIKAVRATLGTLRPTATMKHCKIPITVTGPLFQDFGHGQTGAGKNMIEIHPILRCELSE